MDTPHASLPQVCNKLNSIQQELDVWQSIHRTLFAKPPPSTLTQPQVKRTCRRSELLASLWRDPPYYPINAGYESSQLVKMDDTTAVTADGPNVRVWSIASGRKIATLSPRMSGKITALEFNPYLIGAGDESGAFRLWDPTDFSVIRLVKVFREPIVGLVALPTITIVACASGTVDLYGN